MPARRLVILALVVGSLLAVSCSASGHDDGLRVAGDSSPAGGTIPQVPMDTPFIVELMYLCVRSSPVQITGVELVRPQGDMHVLDWGVRVRSANDRYSHRPSENPGARPGLLSAVPGFNHAKVATRCDDGAEATEFDVDVKITSVAAAVSHGFRVLSKHGSVVVPFTLTLCAKACPRKAVMSPAG